MLRQRWGSVVCPGCRNLVGVQDERCLNCGRWNPGLWGFAPLLGRLGRDLGFTPVVMWSCIILYLATILLAPGGIDLGLGLLNFLSPDNDSLFLFGGSGAGPVFRAGRWWTVLSAGWLHGGLLHILFNMMSLRNLAPLVGDLYGASRMVIIYTTGGIAGFTASSLAGQFLGWLPIIGGADLTVGASAGICAFLGALFYYGKRGGSRMIGDQAKSWAIGTLILGLFLPFIDNWAHAGGFVGGYVSSKFLDPLYPERLDHFLAALACLALTAIAIALSIISGWSIVNG